MECAKLPEIFYGAIAHLTDTHFPPFAAGNIPQGRTETFFEDQDKEWYAFVQLCKDSGVRAVVISGDIVHLKEYSHYRVRDIHRICNMLNALGVPVYLIPGNHDLRNSNLDNYGDSVLRAVVRMSESNSINVMDHVQTISLTAEGVDNAIDISISGSAYASLEDTFERGLPALNDRLANAPGFKIGLVHTDAMQKGAKYLPGHGIMASFDDVLDALPAADLVCGGHIHHGSGIYAREVDGRPQWYSKPFSFGRVVKDYFATSTDMREQHIPTCTIVNFVAPDASNPGAVQVRMVETIIPYVPFERAFVPDQLKRILEREQEMSAVLGKISDIRDQIAANANDPTAVQELITPDTVLASMDIQKDVRDVIAHYRRRA